MHMRCRFYRLLQIGNSSRPVENRAKEMRKLKKLQNGVAIPGRVVVSHSRRLSRSPCSLSRKREHARSELCRTRLVHPQGKIPSKPKSELSNPEPTRPECASRLERDTLLFRSHRSTGRAPS